MSAVKSLSILTAVVAAIGLLPLGGVVANAQGGLGSVDDLVKFIVRNAENAPRRTASVDDIRNTTRAVLQPAAEEGTGFNIILKPACTALDIYGFDTAAAKLFIQREYAWIAPRVITQFDRLIELQRYQDSWGVQAADLACEAV